jgi:hypothetical protein
MALELKAPGIIPLKSSSSVIEGDQISTLGYPGSRRATDSVVIGGMNRQRAYVQFGPLLDRLIDPDGRNSMRIKVFGDGGESGSPLIDQHGYAVGVLVMKEKGGYSFVWGVPTEDFLEITQ